MEKEKLVEVIELVRRTLQELQGIHKDLTEAARSRREELSWIDSMASRVHKLSNKFYQVQEYVYEILGDPPEGDNHG
jgi:hypothetical protein